MCFIFFKVTSYKLRVTSIKEKRSWLKPKKMKTHKDLIVWRKSIAFVTEIYANTKKFPREETYSLTSQVRRAAISIPANIAEGSGRKNVRELMQFINIAMGSASELETLLLISKNLLYLTIPTYENLDEQLREIIRMLNGLSKSIK